MGQPILAEEGSRGMLEDERVGQGVDMRQRLETGWGNPRVFEARNSQDTLPLPQGEGIFLLLCVGIRSDEWRENSMGRQGLYHLCVWIRNPSSHSRGGVVQLSKE